MEGIEKREFFLRLGRLGETHGRVRVGSLYRGAGVTGRGSWDKSFSQGSRPGQGPGRTLIEGKEMG